MRLLLAMVLLLVACQPTETAPARPAGRVVVVTEQGVKATPRPCGAACQPEATPTESAFFAQAAATIAALPPMTPAAVDSARRAPQPTPSAAPPPLPTRASDALGTLNSILGAPRVVATPSPVGLTRPSRPTPPAR